MSRKSTVRKRLFCQLTIIFVLILFAPYGSEIAEAQKISETLLTYQTADTLSSGTFSALTYNIAGLPELISSAKTKRAPSIAQIGKLLNRFDVVHVQEDFNYNKYLYYSGNTHPHRTIPKGKIPFGDGLNTLSRLPVRQTIRIPWSHCTGADCLTPKGFTYSRLQIAQNTYIDLYNVHTNAYNHKSAAAARRENIRQLCSFIRQKSWGQAVIIMGDLNAHYAFELDNLQELVQETKLKDAWLELCREDRMPIQSPLLPDDNILEVTNETESIDKILYRSSDLVSLHITDYQIQNALFFSENNLPLSDHHPVSVVISWRLSKIPAISKNLVVAK